MRALPLTEWPNTFRFLLPLALVAAGCGPLPEEGVDEEETAQLEQGLDPRFDTGRVIVKFKVGTSASDKSLVHRLHGAAFKKRLESGAEVVTVSRASTRSVLAKYKGHGKVQWAEIDAKMPHSDTAERRPNDTYVAQQWQHNAIQAPGAWAVGTGSSTMLLAICDTGVSATHPDLRASLRTDLCWNTVYGSAGNCDPVASHGTETAGAAAAIGNNALGVAGTAWSAAIIPVRVSNEFDGSAFIADMADCISYASSKGAKVINLSYQTYDNGTIYQTILDAAATAETRGSVVFVASGNEGVNAVTSQDPTQVVFVGATDKYNKVASFSNYGAYVDLAAPGVDIVTTSVDVNCTDRDYDGVADPGECVSSNDGYVYTSGTSYASPIAAGGALVLRAINPSLDPAGTRSALYTTATDLGVTGSDAYYGFGLVNLHAAAHKVQAITNTAPTVRILSPTPGAVATAGMPLIVQGTASDIEDGDLSGSIRWDFGDGQTATGAVWGAHAYSAAGTYVITASATDRAGVTGRATFTLTVVAPTANRPPVLTVTAPGSSVTVVQGTTVRFTGTATDPEDGDISASINWRMPDGSVVRGFSISTAFNTAGSFTVAVSVTDQGGLSASAAVQVVVQSPGTVAAPTGLSATALSGRRVQLRWVDQASNESGFYVERALVSSSGIGTWYRRATLAPNSTTYTDSASKGTWAYRVRAFNAAYSAVSSTVQVRVR